MENDKSCNCRLRKGGREAGEEDDSSLKATAASTGLLFLNKTLSFVQFECEESTLVNRGDSVDHRIRRELRVKGREGNRVILKPVSGPMTRTYSPQCLMDKNRCIPA